MFNIVDSQSVHNAYLLKAEDLNTYYSGILKKFRKKFNVVLKNPEDEEAIHAVRVSIKRINAFSKFIKHINKHFDYDTAYSPLQKLYKEIGNSRDPQLMLDQVYKILGESGKSAIIIKANHALNISKYRKIFKKDFFKAHQINVEHAIKQCSLKKGTVRYLDSLKTQIKSIINLNPGTRMPRLHELRKLLKEMQYNLHFLATETDLECQGEKADAQLKYMTNLLGDWHDRKMLLAEIGEKNPVFSFVKGNSGAKTRLEKEIKLQCNLLLSRINVLCADKGEAINFLINST